MSKKCSVFNRASASFSQSRVRFGERQTDRSLNPHSFSLFVFFFLIIFGWLQGTKTKKWPNATSFLTPHLRTSFLPWNSLSVSLHSPPVHPPSFLYSFATNTHHKFGRERVCLHLSLYIIRTMSSPNILHIAGWQSCKLLLLGKLVMEGGSCWVS